MTGGVSVLATVVSCAGSVGGAGGVVLAEASAEGGSWSVPAGAAPSSAGATSSEASCDLLEEQPFTVASAQAAATAVKVSDRLR